MKALLPANFPSRTLTNSLHTRFCICTQFRYTGQADPSAPGGMAEIYRALIADPARLDQIIADVLAAHTNGAIILVLTTWIDHLNAIAERLRNDGKSVVVLSGQWKARQRRDLRTTRQPHRRHRTLADRRHQLIHRRGI